MPSRKRFSVTILDETFKTQKALIERVKPTFESLGLQKNQNYIQAFVSTCDKVQRQNKKKYFSVLKDAGRPSNIFCLICVLSNLACFMTHSIHKTYPR